MASTTRYRFGDVVLVPFPFTDQRSAKRRPVVVVSSSTYHQQQVNVIVMAVTSMVDPSLRAGEVLLGEWKKAGLLKPSMVKPMLATLERRLVVKRLGRLSEKDAKQVREALNVVLGP